MRKNPKPIVVVVPDEELPDFQDWLKKGHTVLAMSQYSALSKDDRPAVDAIIHPTAFPLRPDDPYVSRPVQKDLVEKAIRAQKYSRRPV